MSSSRNKQWPFDCGRNRWLLRLTFLWPLTCSFVSVRACCYSFLFLNNGWLHHKIYGYCHRYCLTFIYWISFQLEKRVLLLYSLLLSLFDSAWLCLALLGSAWLCLALLGFAWLCLALVAILCPSVFVYNRSQGHNFHWSPSSIHSHWLVHLHIRQYWTILTNFDHSWPIGCQGTCWLDSFSLIRRPICMQSSRGQLNRSI